MSIEATHLGKQSNYPQHYSPNVLVAVPRILNREQYAISNNNLPFTGIDIWHAYEFSFLTNNGLPVVGILKICYNASSEFLFESKSLKLYLNSFNMEKIGDTKTEGILKTTHTIKLDLEKILNSKVSVSLIQHNATISTSDFDSYEIIEDTIQNEELNFTIFEEEPALLDQSNSSGEIKWGTHLLRSNCKITHQPDWGSLFIWMKSDRLPSKEGFLKYIVSLRNENHFHEEICEMVFKRIADKYKPETLTLTCLYTRRGGIDINPTRSLRISDLPENLINQSLKTTPIFRQ